MEISRAFSTLSESVSYFFRRAGLGYYIPLYQREYSWDQENIDQLMDDICSGVYDLLKSLDNLHFMGTIILVTENDVENNINPQDSRALPSRIDNVIDGQQRLSTITLLASSLYRRVCEITKKLPEDPALEDLREASNTYLRILQDIFSFDLMRGTPNRKPIIIRGSIDGWTLSGEDCHNYKSDVSSFLASFIRSISDNSSFPEAKKNSLVADNLKVIRTWLDKVELAHKLNQNEDFPPASEILEKVNQVELWSYQRPELVKLVQHPDNPMTPVQENVCSLVQLFAFCYYLLNRCCFTLIQPVSQIRAFDMFQSLNATGTPLTALETFKPMVVNIADSQGQGFKESKFEEYFTQVEKLTSSLRSASSKNKRTNEYLSLFSSAYEGKRLSKQFSAQRKWLIDIYDKCKTMAEKEEFIRRMGDTARYCSKLIYSNKNLLDALPEIETVDALEKKQAAFCLFYLQEAGHRMANTILSRFYALVLRQELNADNNFVFACKAVAAFFTLWRSAQSNAGLDDVYRKLLKDSMSWEKGSDDLNVQALKTYFKQVLNDQGIGTKNDWINKAVECLRYDNAKAVCKFTLFVTAHDTIPDPTHPGLMKIGTQSSSPPYLEPNQWVSNNFKSIEHIAPQKPELRPENVWDKSLYGSNEDYQKIGNLTLLPTEINSSAGNKGWLEKWIYYRHLAETDPDKLTALTQEAENNGVDLKPTTIDLLKNMSYNHHILPIVQLGATGQWDKRFVDQRTERICDILWTRLYGWLS